MTHRNLSQNLCSTLTFIIKSVDPVDAGTFMVAPQQEEILWVLDFVG